MSHLPVRSRRVSNLAQSVSEIDEEIAVVSDKIPEILLDDLSFIAAGNHEIAVTMFYIDIHHVPEHWHAADFNHRLGARRCLL